MIVLRNNTSHLDEKGFTGEKKLVKRYLLDAADSIGRGEVRAVGVKKGIENNIIVPFKRFGIKVKGKVKGKAKDHIKRDIASFEARRARSKGTLRGWEEKDLLNKVHDININTSSPSRSARVPYPNKLAVTADRKGISELADVHSTEKEMKKVIGKSRKRAARKADYEAERLPTSLAPQL